MAQKLNFDDGLLRLDVNGNGILCFSPSDFNLYKRFCDFVNRIPAMEKEYQAAVEDTTKDGELENASYVLGKAMEMDLTIKHELNVVFGGETDFDKLFAGINVMSWAGNGERVLTNFLDAITPYLEKGVKKYMEAAAAKAKGQKTKKSGAKK